MEKLFGNQKGHGYLRKTNLGLVGSILLASSLFMTLGTNPILAAQEEKVDSTENVASNGKSETKDEFVREETVTVKESTLKAKVEEVKTAGVTVEEKPAVAVGLAKSETEKASLKKEAEAKVDEQIKALEEAKKEELARQAKVKEVEKTKEYFIENKQKKDYLITHLNSRDAEEGKSKKFSDFSSNKDTVYFLNLDKIDLTKEETIGNMWKNRVTNVAKKINATLNTKNGVKNTDAYIFKVRNGETISYNVKMSEDSYLSKNFGIDTISIKRSYNFGFTNQPKYYDVLTNNLTETNYIFTSIYNSTNPKIGTPHVTTEYLYKDKLGNTIPLDELYIKVINDGIFYNNKLLNSNNISYESLKKIESDKKKHKFDTKLKSTGYSVALTTEGGVAKTINYSLDKEIEPGKSSFLDFTFNAYEKSDFLKGVDYKKLLEPVSANYHLVTYKKLIDTGVVQQKFVDEQGNEIAPTITSEKSDKGSTVTVTTPPNEITYKGQTYLLQKENIPNSLVIKKGINSVTFTYKKVVSEKGTPEILEGQEFNGGVVPNEAPKTKQDEQIKQSTVVETSKTNENEVQTSTEKTLPTTQEKEVVHQTASEKVVPNKQVLPNTGTADTNLYYTISASIMSLLGMMSLKFKKKEMK